MRGGSDWLRWQGLLRPLVPLYSAGVAAKNAGYARGWLRGRRLEAPVISVGNLSVGGAGKTPLVIRLAELLAARGFAVDVLSRGYGGRTGAARQVCEGPEAAALYGDEPLLIAQSAGVPVYVGASRYEAGLLAERSPVPPGARRVHLLDDGFQHRRLARAVDVVVLHRSDFEAGLLPAGRLREPLSALGRASIAVLRVEDASFAAQLRSGFPGVVIWLIAREIVLPAECSPAVAFCGIAHPGEFFAGLARAGVQVAATHAFRDHHAYTDADVLRLSRSVRATGARTLLTTAKDLVRLSGRQRARLGECARVEAVGLRVRLVDEAGALEGLVEMAGLG